MVLAGAATKARNAQQVQKLLALAADAKLATPLRVALLDGVTVGLQGAVPTTGGVADGRAGTGVPGVAAAPRRRAGLFELAAAPTAVIDLAAGGGSLAAPAKSVLAMMTWPGKPAAAPLAPLSAVEQKRYVTGKALYEANCAACHLPEGQGQPRVSGPLAGSRIVNGAADVVIRVLINGKDGAIGLMPPLGAGMSDDDLSAVLTYVRRSWGNTGDPVLPALVREMRLAYAHRATPWTDQELAVRAR
jgi:mono/diheme cytochrome c family protein